MNHLAVLFKICCVGGGYKLMDNELLNRAIDF